MAKQTTRITVKPEVTVKRQTASKLPQMPEAAAFLTGMPPSVQPLLAQTVDLRAFRQTVHDLSLSDRLILIEQALVLLEQNYAHLPLKSAMYAISPVRRLRLLQDQTIRADAENQLTDQQFHREMLSIFLSLRDLHTNYVLPAPYNRMIAFVPFLIEEFHEDGQRRYLVSRLIAGFNQPPFGPGAEVLSWNGIPIARAVELNGDRFAGSNPDARRARGVETMTIRSLSGSLPPDEDHVVVEYRTANGDVNELRIDWLVFSPDDPTGSASVLSPRLAAAIAMDEELRRVREARKILFVPEVVEASRKAALQGAAERTHLGLTSALPETLEAREVSTPDGNFGYIRIRTFFQDLGPTVDFVEAFIQEFIRLVVQLPHTGLIIDVRGNGGGIVWAGERLLQLLTPRRVIPEPAQFINSALNLQLCERLDFLQDWVHSIQQAVRSGATFSSAFPITPPDVANDIGQIYHGPVVLITDALCYSTTDIFAAGFQDHKIGPILGIAGNTGAGGANVFSHADIVKSFFPPTEKGSPYRKLPNGANMRVAIRRTLRVHDRAGDPVEDFGVIPDARHFMTRNDLLNRNVDLINAAGKTLAGLPVRRLDVRASSDASGQPVLDVTTQGVTRLDIYIDHRPFGSVDVGDGQTELTVATKSASSVRLEGFHADQLVASRLLQVD